MNDIPKVEIAVIGAGVVGLAIAYELSSQAKEVCVLEKYESFGQESSSRNSEVLHAGLYYPKDFLKTRLCVQGNALLRSYFKEYNIPFNLCGKLVVATDPKEEESINKLYENGMINGVPDLRLISSKDPLLAQNDIYARMGLYSGSTGIMDSHALMRSLYYKAKEQGALFLFLNEIVGIEKEGEGFIIISQGEKLCAQTVINAAGLSSAKIAHGLGLEYKMYYCKGDYFAVSGAKGKLKQLIYPAPSVDVYGLGVHATIDLAGELKLGPDAEYVDKLEYDIDPQKSKKFFESVVKFLPWLKEENLSPDTSGIRPKLQGLGESIKDFVIKKEFSGFIDLVGIESPGLTASLAIAKYVSNLI